MSETTLDYNGWIDADTAYIYNVNRGVVIEEPADSGHWSALKWVLDNYHRYSQPKAPPDGAKQRRGQNRSVFLSHSLGRRLHRLDESDGDDDRLDWKLPNPNTPLKFPYAPATR